MALWADIIDEAGGLLGGQTQSTTTTTQTGVNVGAIALGVAGLLTIVMIVYFIAKR